MDKAVSSSGSSKKLKNTSSGCYLFIRKLESLSQTNVDRWLIGLTDRVVQPVWRITQAVLYNLSGESHEPWSLLHAVLNSLLHCHADDRSLISVVTRLVTGRKSGT